MRRACYTSEDNARQGIEQGPANMEPSPDAIHCVRISVIRAGNAWKTHRISVPRTQYAQNSWSQALKRTESGFRAQKTQ
jgi:hypothetical protein